MIPIDTHIVNDGSPPVIVHVARHHVSVIAPVTGVAHSAPIAANAENDIWSVGDGKSVAVSL